MSEYEGEGSVRGCVVEMLEGWGCENCWHIWEVIFTMVFNISGVFGVWPPSWVVAGVVKLQFREILEFFLFMMSLKTIMFETRKKQHRTPVPMLHNTILSTSHSSYLIWEICDTLYGGYHAGLWACFKCVTLVLIYNIQAVHYYVTFRAVLFLAMSCVNLYYSSLSHVSCCTVPCYDMRQAVL